MTCGGPLLQLGVHRDPDLVHGAAERPEDLAESLLGGPTVLPDQVSDRMLRGALRTAAFGVVEDHCAPPSLLRRRTSPTWTASPPPAIRPRALSASISVNPAEIRWARICPNSEPPERSRR